MIKNVTRRSFLRTAAVAGAGLVVAACQPKVVEVTKIVEKEVEKVVKETVIVEGRPKSSRRSSKRLSCKKSVEKEQSDLMAKADDSAIVSAAGSGKIVLEFWNGLTGEDGITMIKICQQFTEKNPEVTIKTQRIPWGNYFDKLLPPSSLALAPICSSCIAANCTNGSPRMFWRNSMISLRRVFCKRMISTRLSPGCFEGWHVMGLPIDAYGPVLWLNLDCWKRLASSMMSPRADERDEFLQVATAPHLIRAESIRVKVVLIPRMWILGAMPTRRLWHGSEPEWGGFGQHDGSCQAMVTDERYIDAITFCRDLRWKYYVQSSGDYDAAQAMGAASWLCSTTEAGSITGSEFLEHEMGVWYLPQYGANKVCGTIRMPHHPQGSQGRQVGLGQEADTLYLEQPSVGR
jgi:hypothetical protein